MDYDDLKFFGQGIHQAQTKEIVFFELLLRKGEDKNVFPKELYTSFISQQEEHQRYVKWLKKKLSQILDSNPDKKFSVNLDPQELEYEETFALLEELKRYKNRLLIEVTETPPLKQNESTNLAGFKRIAQMGYQVALDDIGQGMNSLDCALKLQDYFQIIKFSTLEFRKNVSDEKLQEIILRFAQVARQLEKTFVVEGIENQQFADWLEANISCYHQGYLYSIPENILTIDY